MMTLGIQVQYMGIIDFLLLPLLVELTPRGGADYVYYVEVSAVFEVYT